VAYRSNSSCGGGVIMITAMIWFFGVITAVTILHLIENYIGSIQPGRNSTYILQPVYKYIKLFSKKSRNEHFLTGWLSAGALWFGLAALWMTVSGGNYLFILSVLIMMELFILTGACSSKELFGTMAAQRGIARFIIWSFTCMVTAASLYKVTGTLELGKILEYSSVYSLLRHLPLNLASLFIVFMLKSNICNFDFGITGKGMSFLDAALYTPYSGWDLAVIQLTQWVETGVWLKLISVFLPWKPWISFIISAVVYLGVLLADGFIPKQSWKRVARNAWIWAGGMAVINYIWLYMLI